MITSSAALSTAVVASHYDALDPFYRELWGEHLHHGFWERGDEDVEQAVCALVDRVVAAARIERGQSVCDVGCGYGATARRIARQYAADVVGLTVSRAQAEHAARAGGAPHAPRIVCRDWLENGLPSESYDAVIAIESSEHVADKGRFFAEAARVLRPGGRIVVCAWLSREDPDAWQRRLLLEPICREGRLASLATAPEYVDWLKGAGFVDVGWEDWSEQVRRTWAICAYRMVTAVATRRRYRSALLRGPEACRVFARCVLRIGAAYAVGAMKYGMFAATR
jgi:tocopherol O-methyltransferase